MCISQTLRFTLQLCVCRNDNHHIQTVNSMKILIFYLTHIIRFWKRMSDIKSNIAKRRIRNSSHGCFVILHLQVDLFCGMTSIINAKHTGIRGVTRNHKCGRACLRRRKSYITISGRNRYTTLIMHGQIIQTCIMTCRTGQPYCPEFPRGVFIHIVSRSRRGGIYIFAYRTQSHNRKVLSIHVWQQLSSCITGSCKRHR